MTIMIIQDKLKLYSDQRNTKLAFGKRPTGDDLQQFKSDLQEGLGENGLNKTINLIMPGASCPAAEGQETGVGSFYSDGGLEMIKLANTLGIKKLIDIPNGEFKKYVFPNGKTIMSTHSPYETSSFAGNPLYIDLVKLATPEWGNLLKPDEFSQALIESDKSSAKCNYYDEPNNSLTPDALGAFSRYEKALKTAFDRFQEEKDSDPTIKEIANRFETFKKEKNEHLEPEALYDTLIKIHCADEFKDGQWNRFNFWNENDKGEGKGIDKNLYAYLETGTDEQKAEAKVRIAELNKKENTEFYKFKQFILDEMKTERIAELDEMGIKPVADKKVGFSEVDEWANPDAFLQGWKLGVPPDFHSEDGQAWNFPVINPDKLFIRDENGEIEDFDSAGKLVFQTFDKIFKENKGGVRIDHIIGLIDPWVYPEDEGPSSKRAGRLSSSPEHPELKHFSKVPMNAIDSSKSADSEEKIKQSALSDEVIDSYAVITEIILLAAKKNNVKKKDIVFEDLGTITSPVKAVFEKYKLSGIGVTEYVKPTYENDVYRAKNIPSHYHCAIGTHDNATLYGWINDIEDQKGQHINMLVDDLQPSNPEKFRKELKKDDHKFVTAKVAEGFIGSYNNLQIFFADLFGMKDRYNHPAGGPDNFTLRAPQNPEKAYFKRVEEGKALNLPEVFAMALESKHDDTKKPLIEKLKGWADYLKQPEDN